MDMNKVAAHAFSAKSLRVFAAPYRPSLQPACRAASPRAHDGRRRPQSTTLQIAYMQNAAGAAAHFLLSHTTNHGSRTTARLPSRRLWVFGRKRVARRVGRKKVRGRRRKGGEAGKGEEGCRSPVAGRPRRAPTAKGPLGRVVLALPPSEDETLPVPLLPLLLLPPPPPPPASPRSAASGRRADAAAGNRVVFFLTPLPPFFSLSSSSSSFLSFLSLLSPLLSPPLALLPRPRPLLCFAMRARFPNLAFFDDVFRAFFGGSFHARCPAYPVRCDCVEIP